MAIISINTSCDVELTNKEREIFQEASEICMKIASDIWRNGGESDEDCAIYGFFHGIGASLGNALKGCYWEP